MSKSSPRTRKLIPAQIELRKHATDQNRKVSEWFFKTAPGEYGHGDRFIGVKIPPLRKVAKQFFDSPLSDLETLIQSPIHEDRMLALVILVKQYGKAAKNEDSPLLKKLFQFYWKHKARVNNWDLVDSSAPYLTGHYAFHRPDARKKLFGLIRSKSLWDRRIAMISTFYFLRQKEFKPVLDLARILLKDEEDLMHKASGWMLREMGKRDLLPLRTFLDRHAHEMPRTMLRYSLEKLSPIERRRYLGMKIPKKSN